jgi:hypothetical protein
MAEFISSLRLARILHQYAPKLQSLRSSGVSDWLVNIHLSHLVGIKENPSIMAGDGELPASKRRKMANS